MELAQNIRAVRAKIAQAAADAGRTPGEITLCAATKVQTSDTIRQAIAAGITVCGENRVQEMTAHLADNAYEGAALHFIGHLQTNKVKFVVGRASLIESVGSEHLLMAIEKQAEKISVVQDILLEVNVGGEESKSGIRPDQVDERLFEACLYTAGLPDVDLLIRTSGEMRLSNFLLYQISYAEFVVVDTLWPDFNLTAYRMALKEYQKRDRRFGGVKA